jgi:putative toxin-antitoxin system antitoxin component (TIGR02293 family)
MGTVNEVFVRYNKSIDGDYNIMISSKLGVSPQVFDDIINISGLGRTYLAEEIFDMSLKTIMRYQKDNKNLNPRTSEVALKLLNLLKKGIGVFGSSPSFKAWLNKPAYGLGDELPLHLLNTITGIDLIEEELIRIEYGALA